METKLTSLSQRYQAALKRHIDQGPRASPQSADELGRRALALGLETLDLARIHEQVLIALRPPNSSSRAGDGMLKRAQAFFVRAVTPIEKTHRTAMEANVRLSQLNRTLRGRTGELAAANRKLKGEIVRRHAVEKALKKSERHYACFWGNPVTCRSSCGICPARFYRPRRKNEGGSAASFMMKSPRF